MISLCLKLVLCTGGPRKIVTFIIVNFHKLFSDSLPTPITISETGFNEFEPGLETVH